MSIGFPAHPQKNSQPKYTTPRSVGHSIYKDFGHQLLDYLNQSGTSGLGTPLGILGPIYQNLFGGGEGDYLGAKSAIQDTLSGFSGRGLDTAISSARNQLLPSTLLNIEQGSSALRNAAGPTGLRFSTDLLGQQNQFAQNQFNQLGQQSLGAGLDIFNQVFNQRAKSAQDIFSLIGQLGQQNNPLTALMQFLGFGGAPQLANFGGGGGGGGGNAAYRGPGPGGTQFG